MKHHMLLEKASKKRGMVVNCPFPQQTYNMDIIDFEEVVGIARMPRTGSSDQWLD